VGAVGGPVGALVGAIAGGAVAGGLAGTGVGELIDPTTEDNWLRESFTEKKYVRKGETYDTYAPAYKYGAEAQSRYHGKAFADVETDIRSGWEKAHAASGMAWDRAREAVRDSFDRTMQLREERLNVTKEQVRTGDAKVRKEVHTEHKQITVPVEREELVIERRPAHGRAAAGDIKAEEIRIPLKEEKVNVSKETVVKEEVSVGKRKVQDQRTVDADLKREELVVEDETKKTTTRRTDKK
jgi:uncharacterized protein (TIGR02271 family)